MRVLPESDDDNPLKRFFLNNQGRLISKWLHYFDIYHNHFRRFRDDPDRPVRLLEIGVFRGGSLEMWRDYFGATATIHGVDVDERCRQFAAENTHVHIGNQADRTFLERLVRQAGPFDIVIDDGGHRMTEQHVSFDVLYPAVVDDGVYLVEDLHTSYWHHWGAGPQQSHSFIERAKRMVDSVNAWHTRSADFGPTMLTRTATGIHFYDSVLVLEKCPNPKPPRAAKTGVDPFGTVQATEG